MKKPAPFVIKNQRAAACIVLHEILHQNHDLEFAWGRVKQRADAHASAWARNAVLSVLRLRGALDAWLQQQLRKPLGESAAMVQTILRVGIVELVLQKEPPHAVVNELVELSKQWGFEGLSGLVNAVLKKAAQLDEQSLLNIPDARYVPAWWAKAGVQTEGFAKALNTGKPPLDMFVKEDAAAWEQKLGGALLGTHTVRVQSYGEVTELEGYDEGAWWVQDVAASLPVQMLGEVRGKRVLDLCATPGGRTAQLCALGAEVTALDRSEKRLKRLHENMQRLGFAPDVVVADALEWNASQPFDAIIVDAPCSATGTFRRNPDVLWTRSPEGVAELVELQAKLFAKAAEWLAPSGTLVYAVCSLMPQEGERQAERFAKMAGLTHVPLTSADGFAHGFVDAAGNLRTRPSMLPEQGHLDGFFAARFTNKV